MAYSVVPTVITGDSWTAGNQNTYVRDNFRAVIPDIFTATGQIAYATGADGVGVIDVGTDKNSIFRVNDAGTAIEYGDPFVGAILSTIEKSSLSSGAWSQFTITCDTSAGDYDSGGFTDPDILDSFITIPYTGVYQFSGQYNFGKTYGAWTAGMMNINGSTDESVQTVLFKLIGFNSRVSTGTIWAHNFCYVTELNAADQVSFFVYSSTNSTANISVEPLKITCRYLGTVT